MKGRDADQFWLLVLFVLMIVTTVASIRYGAIDFSSHDMAAAVSESLPAAMI